MTDVDWNKHRLEVSLLRANGIVNLREYSERHGLPYNTARRELSNTKISKLAGETPTDHKADQSSDQLSKKNADHTTDQKKNDELITKSSSNNDHSEKKTPKNPPKKRTKNASDSTVIERKTFRSPPSDHAELQSKKTDIIFENNNVDEDSALGGRKRASQKKRRTEKKIVLPEDINQSESDQIMALFDRGSSKRLIESGPDNHLRIVMQQTQENMDFYQAVVAYEADKLCQQMNEPDIPPDKDAIPTVPPSVRLRKMLEEAQYLLNDYAARVGSLYQKQKQIDQNAIKLRQSALQIRIKKSEARAKLQIAHEQMVMREREILRREAQKDRHASIVAEAIRLREKETLDDVDVAEYIEERGAPVPFSIAFRARRAIEAIEPPVSDTSDIDDEKIEKEAREFARKRADHPKWLKERRETVTRIANELGCGDTDQTGERRAGEFDADDDGLDIDFDATSDVYSDDEEIQISPPSDDE